MAYCPRFHFMDEPEAALQFVPSLSLVALLHGRDAAGGQVIVASHSAVSVSGDG
jgi:predicted ATPase